MEAGAPSGAQLAAAVRRRLRWVAVLANTLGAIDVFLFLAFLVPVSGGRPDDVSQAIVLNAIAGTLYLALTLWLGIRWANREFDRVERWLCDERPATEADRKAALGIPLTVARVSAVLWMGAALAFTALNVALARGDHRHLLRHARPRRPDDGRGQLPDERADHAAGDRSRSGGGAAVAAGGSGREDAPAHGVDPGHGSARSRGRGRLGGRARGERLRLRHRRRRLALPGRSRPVRRTDDASPSRPARSPIP